MTGSGKIRTLGQLLLKLETRSRNGSNRKLLLLNISYLIPGIFLPLILFKQNTDPAGFEFAFLTYVIFSLILSFTIISELDKLVVSRTEVDLFSSMPLDDKVMAGAKMYMLIRYVFFLSLPLLLPGSVFYFLLVRSYSRTFLYLVCGLMLCLFIINIAVLIYSFALKIFKSKNLSVYTINFQMIMVLILVVGFQFVSFGITGKSGSSISAYFSSLQAKGILDYFPQSWYAILPAKNNYILDSALILKFFLPLVVCYMSYLSLKMYLVENYSYLKEKFIYSQVIDSYNDSVKRRFFIFQLAGDFIQKIYLRNNLERSSYGLIKSLYQNDKAVRLAILPMIIIPAGLALFALITNRLPYLFAGNYFAAGPVFHISILLCVIVVINTAIIGVKITNYPGTSWIYESYPIKSNKHFKNGFRKFFVINLLMPVCILLFIIFAIKIPLQQAFVHTLFIFASANLYCSVYNLLSKTLPFTKENTLINSLQRMASILYPFLFGIVIVFIQFYAYKSILSALIGILCILTINFWLNYFGFVRDKSAN